IPEQAAYLSYSFAPILRQADNQPGALEYLATKSPCTEMVAGISPCPFMTMREVTILSRRDKGTNAAISRSHACLKQHFVWRLLLGKRFRRKGAASNFHHYRKTP